MIKNSYISLAPDSITRNDAVNSIKYTLLLDYRVPSINNDSDLIPSVMESCQNCCQGLFKDTLSPYKITFNFFGTSSLPLSPETSTIRKRNLSYLEHYPLNKWDYPDINPSIGFPSMILDHCIFSAYHAILTDLLSDSEQTPIYVSGYKLRNHLKEAGFYSVYKKKIYNPYTEKFSKAIKGTENRDSSSLASDFAKRAQTHLTALSYLSGLFCKNPVSDGITHFDTYSLQFSGLFFHICNTKPNIWKFFSSLPEKNSDNTCKIDEIIEDYNNLSTIIFSKINNSFPAVPEPTFTKAFGTIVDDLYYRYIYERIFNIELIYSLLRNIQYVEKSNALFKFCQDGILDILKCCQDLPNVFSRQYFLRYAFGQCITKPFSYKDFWADHPLLENNSPLDFGRGVFENHFQFAKWIEQFRLFCKYMAYYVIPIYEWCFTCLLMDTIEANFKNSGNDKDKNHKEHLIYALDTLASYIEKNYKRILRPIEYPDNQDELDIITKHRKDTKYLDSFPDNTLLKFFNKFRPFTEKNGLQDKVLDLNLSQLNPNFFRHFENDKTLSSEKRIRDFYINLTQFLK